MADVVNPATRSRMMAGIRGKNTKPEIALRKALHALGLRFRVNVRELPGSPDILLPRWKAAVLVHGCFWHRHEGCRFTTTPATRPEFWQAKFAGNIERDRRTTATLEDLGWRVAIVWECALRSAGASESADRLSSWLHERSPPGDTFIIDSGPLTTKPADEGAPIPSLRAGAST